MQSVTAVTKSAAKLTGIEEAAQQLSLSVWTIRAYVQRGVIASVKVGARRLIPVREIERIAEGGLKLAAKAAGEAE